MSGDVTQSFTLQQYALMRALIVEHAKALQSAVAPVRTLVEPSTNDELKVAVSLLEKLDARRVL